MLTNFILTINKSAGQVISLHQKFINEVIDEKSMWPLRIANCLFESLYPPSSIFWLARDKQLFKDVVASEAVTQL